MVVRKAFLTAGRLAIEKADYSADFVAALKVVQWVLK